MAKQNSQIYPIYFLYGPEAYLIESEIERLLNQTLSPQERGLNLHLFNGREHSVEEIIQTAQTLPMFSRYRFVLIRESDQFQEESVETFLHYFRNPSPTTCFVLCAQTPGLLKRYQKEIEKVGKIVEFNRLKGRGLISWVRKRMEEKGKFISGEAASYLVEIVGDHLQDLDNAQEKVFLCVGNKQGIEPSDVEGITSEVKVSTIFDLTDAIGQQDLKKALGILKKALESKTIPFRKEEETAKRKDNDPVPLLVSMMAKHYWNIWRVKEMSSSLNDVGEVAKTLRMQTWNVQKLMKQGRSFSVASLREGILKCHQMDIAIKRSQGPENLLMEKLVIDLCRPNIRKHLHPSDKRVT